MKLRAGELNERITFASSTGARDPVFGGATGVATDLVTVWAKREVKSSSEKEEGKAINSVNTERFYIRYRTGLNANMLLKFEGKTYKITGVSEVRRRETLAIDCEVRDGSN